MGFGLCFGFYVYMLITSNECLCLSTGLVSTNGATFTGNIYMNNGDISLNSDSTLVVHSWEQIVNDSTGDALSAVLNDKQDTLISGTNIKTINNQSLLGSGNITIQGGSGGDTNVIETVKVNGTALTPDSNKAVNISAVTEVYIGGYTA
jgi:lipopolysaccharide export system protein LptA